MESNNTPYVTLEEHFMIPETVAAMQKEGVLAEMHPGLDLTFVVNDSLATKLTEVGSSRVDAMDAGNVQMQILSHAPVSLPNEPSTATCAAANDFLASAIRAHPSRFGGFAWLNMRDPTAAAAELRARVAQGFLGAFLDDHTPDGQKYDDPFFWPVFAAAQELDVPVYLHPTFAPAARDISADKPAQLATTAAYRGNYTGFAAGLLSCAALSWHSETAIHVLRLFAAGVFEQFPRLKLVIGHDGEGLPFFFERIARGADHFPVGKQGTKRTRGFKTVWDENIWITTSGMFGLSPIACMLRNVKPERIMYSIDYPFSTTEMGKQFMEELLKSGMVTREQWEGIGWQNAKRLLKLQ